MHDCPPPNDTLDRWLTPYSSVRSKGRYGHLLLEQDCDCDGDLIDEMRPYFESAHGDARAFFHDQMGIDLHPDAADPAAHATYPSCLPPITRRGLFGEVMAGMTCSRSPVTGRGLARSMVARGPISLPYRWPPTVASHVRSSVRRSGARSCSHPS